MCQNQCIKFKKNKPKDLTKHYYSSENITDCYNLLVNRHRNLRRNLLNYRAARAGSSYSSTRNSPTYDISTLQLKTGSPAVAQRPHDASCLSVVSFNSTMCQVQSSVSS